MKNTFTTSLVTLTIFCGLFVSQAEAETVVRSGQNISVAEDQVIEGDFYSAADIVNISGEVTEDMVSAGGEITINGAVGDDALLIAGRVDVHGKIGDDLRVIAGEVTIAEPIAGDLFVLGAKVNILSTASISGDLIIYGGQAEIKGLVEGDIVGSVDDLRIDAPVNGDVDVSVSQLTLGDRTNIAGNVRYVSHAQVTQSLNATVAGELVRNDPVLPGATSSFRDILIPVLILLFSALVWFLVSRKTLNIVVDKALRKSVRPFLIGLAIILLTPFASVMLMVSTIGALVGIGLMLAYMLVLVLAIISFSVVIGKLLVSLFSKPKESVSLFTIITGVIGTIILVLLPIVGELALIFIIILTLGAIVDSLIKPIFK